MAVKPEGGLNLGRIEYVRESTIGTTPADPAWSKFSDVVTEVTFTPNGNQAGRRGINTSAPWDVDSFTPGGQQTEENTISISYYLQQGFKSGGSSQDAANDFFERDADGQFLNTHSIVHRDERTTGGADSGGIRIYAVSRGAYPSNATVSGDPNTEDPVMVEAEYSAEKIRFYKIDQPSSSTTLTVVSSDSGDTSQTVTIEDEGAGTSEDVSLNGTTVVSTTNTFGDIDAIEVDAETAGDVTVSVNDGTTASPTEGQQLFILDGTSTYDGGEGDLGVPALGNGSHASDIGSSFEEFIGDLVERPSGTTLEEIISSTEFSVENNLETTSRHDSARPAIFRGNRGIQVVVDLVGEDGSWDQVREHLTGVENNVKWTLDNTTLQADSAQLTDVGDITYSTGDAFINVGATFEGQGVTVDP